MELSTDELSMVISYNVDSLKKLLFLSKTVYDQIVNIGDPQLQINILLKTKKFLTFRKLNFLGQNNDKLEKIFSHFVKNDNAKLLNIMLKKKRIIY